MGQHRLFSMSSSHRFIDRWKPCHFGRERGCGKAGPSALFVCLEMRMSLLLWCKTPHCKTGLILGHQGNKIIPRVWKDREVEYLLRQTPTQWIPTLIILPGVIENMVGSREELCYRMCRILLEESPLPNSLCPDFSSYSLVLLSLTPLPLHIFLLWVSLCYLKIQCFCIMENKFHYVYYFHTPSKSFIPPRELNVPYLLNYVVISLIRILVNADFPVLLHC